MYDIYYGGNTPLYNINGYTTMTFDDIYPNEDVFINGDDNTIGYTTITQLRKMDENGVPSEALQSLYYHLLARYGNSPIANLDVHQFSIKLFSIIAQYGPIWKRKLEIQEKLLSLKEEDITLGSKAIHNQAFNDGTMPSTDTLEEIDHINSQNTTKYQKSKIEGYNYLWASLDDDITKVFLDKFQYLFLQIARPTREIYYGTEVSE